MLSDDSAFPGKLAYQVLLLLTFFKKLVYTVLLFMVAMYQLVDNGLLTL